MELIDRAQLIIQDRVEKMIAEGTADQIALTFAQKGIQGVCEDETACAIAVYLMGELVTELGADLARLVYVEVPGGESMHHILVHEEDSSQMVNFSRRVDFPEDSPLGPFAYRFDRRNYPDLIKEDCDGSGCSAA